MPSLARRTLAAAGIHWRGTTDGDRLEALVGVIFGLPSLVVGALGLYLAWLAVKMGRDNENVAAEQMSLMKGQKVLLEELGKLEAKQAELADQQLEMLKRERESKAVLRLIVPHPPMAAAEGQATTYDLYIANDGDKAASCFWYVGIPKRMRGRIDIQPKAGNERVQLAADNWDIFGPFDQPKVACFSDDYFLEKFRTTQPVQAGDWMPCAMAVVSWKAEAKAHYVDGPVVNELRNQAFRVLLWFTNGPGGRQPTSGAYKLRLYGRSESWFKNYHGGIELPEDDPDEVR